MRKNNGCGSAFLIVITITWLMVLISGIATTISTLMVTHP